LPPLCSGPSTGTIAVKKSGDAVVCHATDKITDVLQVREEERDEREEEAAKAPKQEPCTHSFV
jgi:hypothetical protein